MQLIKKFLTDDDENIREIGAVLFYLIRFMIKLDLMGCQKMRTNLNLIHNKELLLFILD